MKECSKSIPRRLADPNFARSYLSGDGVDVGGAPDPLALYAELFPLVKSIRTWDREDGDAQGMAGVPDESVDFVHSSHCLEHLEDPAKGLASWFRILRPGGHLIVTVPDEDLYEQGIFPSTFNADHRWTFTIHKTSSWSSRSISLLELLTQLGAAADIQKIERLTGSFRAKLPRTDQTLSPVGECGIEFIVRKRTPEEIAGGGYSPRPDAADRETRIHFNQYREDHKTLKAANRGQPPFENDAEF